MTVRRAALTRAPIFDDAAIAARRQHWINVSLSTCVRALQDQTWFLTVMIQRAGRLDSVLIVEDQRIAMLPHGAVNTPPEMEKFFHQETLSYLWVLGAWHVIDTLHTKMDAKRITFPGTVGRIKQAKKNISRLRMTFAKAEPGIAGDRDFPHSGGRGLTGSSTWAVTPTTLISRYELSEELLGVLDAIWKCPGPVAARG
jgi:hypothetical protein